MNLKILAATPPWDWPKGTDQDLLTVLFDEKVAPDDRLVAIELAGNFVVINDELAAVLLSILSNAGEQEELRASAAISLGPVLQHADEEEFVDPDDVPITQTTFHRIQGVFRKLYLDREVPKKVRLRVLEAGVRAPEEWHQDAIAEAYRRGDDDWKLTAVFAMRWVRGFDDQILEALKDTSEEIHYEAVVAAGNWQLKAAWSHIKRLVLSKQTDKSVLLAAIDAVASIRPREAGILLLDLRGSDDEDIVEAVDAAMAMSAGPEYVDDEGDLFF